jgi:hypothetical protein
MAPKRPRDGNTSAEEETTKKLCTVEGCECTADLTKPSYRRRHAVLAHGKRVKVENREDGITAKISIGGVVGAYEVLGRIVLRCEGERDGERCSKPTASRSLMAKVRCGTRDPGKSHACLECGARNLTCDVVRLRHKFRVHGEERPLDTTIEKASSCSGASMSMTSWGRTSSRRTSASNGPCACSNARATANPAQA